MTKLNKPKPDKFMKFVKDQDKPSRPPTLGESVATTNWDKHIQAGDNIKSYARVVPDPNKKGQKTIEFTTPQPTELFVAVKESMHGFFWVWILIIEQATGRILMKFNSSQIEFVTWDEEDMPSLDESLADKVSDNPDMHVK